MKTLQDCGVPPITALTCPLSCVYSPTSPFGSELLAGDVQLRWDNVTKDAVAHGRWASKSLAQDPDFEALLESRLDDKQALQTWL